MPKPHSTRTTCKWLALAAATCVLASAQGNPAGSGTIQTWPTDKATAIQYTVTGSSGTGSADFRCQITFPSGHLQELGGSTSPWRNGTASYTWYFYGAESGSYHAHCYWLIAGMGTYALADADFTR